MKVLTIVLKKLIIANMHKQKYEKITSGLRDVGLQLMEVFGVQNVLIKHNKKTFKVSIVQSHKRIHISPTKQVLDLLDKNNIPYTTDVKSYITIEEIKP